MAKRTGQIEYSIIIPTFNSSKYIQRTIHSIKSFFQGQKYEIVIVDDGSQDAIKSKLKALKGNLHFIQQKHAGVSCARNRGIKEALGHYVMFCDADDMLYGQLPSRQFTEDIISFSINCHREACYSSLAGKRKLIASLFSFNRTAEDFPAFYGGSVSKLFKRDFLLGKKLAFDTQLANSEDVLFNIQTILAAKQIRVIHQGIYQYEQHVSSVTHRFDQTLLTNHLYLMSQLAPLFSEEDDLLAKIKSLYLYQLIFRYFAYVSDYRKGYKRWVVVLGTNQWDSNLNRTVERLSIQLTNHLGISKAVMFARIYNALKHIARHSQNEVITL